MTTAEASQPPRLAVGDLVIDTATHEVLRDGRSLALPKLSYDLLLTLVDAAPAVVDTETLAARVWEGRVVSNETITQRVRLLRKAIGDDAQDPSYVGLVRGEGYRLLAEVRAVPEGDEGGTPDPDVAGWPRRLLAVGIAGLVLVAAAWFFLTSEATRPAATPPTVAVLTFRNLSDNPDHRYFAEGLTEAVIDEISRIPDLRVIGRSTRVEGTVAPTGADHVLSGSVRWNGSQAHVGAELVRAGTGLRHWSATYEYEIDNPLSVQEAIARSLASALSLELGTAPRARAGQTEDGRAYAHYLRGLALFWHHLEETNQRAIQEFQEAVSLDPEFVRAWVGLGHAYGARSREPDHTATALRDMAEAARHAVRLAPEYWESHALEAWVRMSYLDFVGADEKMAEALKLRARSGISRAPASCPVACYYQQFGRYTASLAEARRMQPYDPLGPTAETWDLLFYLGRREEAVAAFQQMQTLQGRLRERRLFDVANALMSPDPGPMNEWLESAGSPLAGKWGDQQAVLAIMNRRLVEDAPLRRGSAAFYAMIAARQGDDRLALDFLRREYLTPGYGGYFLIWHPALASTRATPGFVELMTQLGMVDAWRTSGLWGNFCRPAADGTVTCDGVWEVRSEVADAGLEPVTGTPQ